MSLTAPPDILYAPSYLEAELKGTLTFAISWRNNDYSTLTITQIVGSLDTQVVSVNGSNAEFLNNWANKGTANITNGTDGTTMTLTLANVVLEDEGHYKIQVREEELIVESEATHDIVFFTLQTYGKFKQVWKP